MLLVAACGPETKSSEPEHQEEEHDLGNHENSNTAELSAVQIKTVGIMTGVIAQKQLTSSLKANGILKVPNENKATATSLYGGAITSIKVQPGSYVRKRQVIATIANPQFIQFQEEYLTVHSKITLAELEFARQKELTSGNAGAMKNLQSAESELRVLRTRKASLQRQLQLMGINPSAINDQNLRSNLSVLSPIQGVVSNVMSNIGSYVDVSTPIAEIIDNSQLHLDLYVYEKDLPKINVGQTIHFTLTNNAVEEYDAEVFGISNSFEDATKAIAVHCKVKGNKKGLIDGMSISAIVSLDQATVPAVPTEAIINVEGQDYIFIVTDPHSAEEHPTEEAELAHDEAGHAHDEVEREKEHTDATGMVTYERIPVMKGTTDVGYSEITLLKEIPDHALIVVKGAFFISAKMTNQGEGHEH